MLYLKRIFKCNIKEIFKRMVCYSLSWQTTIQLLVRERMLLSLALSIKLIRSVKD